MNYCISLLPSEIDLLKEKINRKIMFCAYSHFDEEPLHDIWFIIENDVIKFSNRIYDGTSDFEKKYFPDYSRMSICKSCLSEIPENVKKVELNERLISFRILRDMVDWTDADESMHLSWDMGIILHMEKRDIVFQIRDSLADFFSFHICKSGEYLYHLLSFHDAALFDLNEEYEPQYKREFVMV